MHNTLSDNTRPACKATSLLSTDLHTPSKEQRSRDISGRTLGSDGTLRGALETHAQQKHSTTHEHSGQPIKTNADPHYGEEEHPTSHCKQKELSNNSPQENGRGREGVTPKATGHHHARLSPLTLELNPNLPSQPPIKETSRQLLCHLKSLATHRTSGQAPPPPRESHAKAVLDGTR